jgi:hypothetical protein
MPVNNGHNLVGSLTDVAIANPDQLMSAIIEAMVQMILNTVRAQMATMLEAVINEYFAQLENGLKS